MTLGCLQLELYSNLVETTIIATDPTKLDDLEMLSLLAHGLIPYMERVAAGEEDPFPYPNALL